ncbi:MAG TPA: hypothetical protein VIL66_00605 [Bacillota bacterium]
MKKWLVLTMSLLMVLASTSLAMAQDEEEKPDKIITTTINGDMVMGYLHYPGYSVENASMDVDFDKGAFIAQFRWFNFRMITDLTLSEEFTAGLVSQFEVYRDEDDSYKTSASPVQNFYLKYNPGPFNVTFDAKGRDINIGFAEYLKLNVARRYARDGEPHIYRRIDRLAKQMTVEVPYENFRGIAVFSLEETHGDPIDFVGAAFEVEVGQGKYAIGYKDEYKQEKITSKINGEEKSFDTSAVKSPIIVAAVDYQFSDDVRLQVDFNHREEDGDGYTGYWRHYEPVENYPATPFKMTNELWTKLTYHQYKFDVRLMKTLKSDTWDKDLAYWLDGSYYFAPFTVGVFYRNYATEAEKKEFGDDDMLEFYAKHDLTSSWRDSLRVFYRTNGSFGAYVQLGLW